MSERIPIAAEPQMLELSAGEHCLCACLKSSQWPICDTQEASCVAKQHTLSLSKSRWVWMCRCRRSQTLPFCDGVGHVQLQRERRKPREA